MGWERRSKRYPGAGPGPERALTIGSIQDDHDTPQADNPDNVTARRVAENIIADAKTVTGSNRG